MIISMRCHQVPLLVKDTLAVARKLVVWKLWLETGVEKKESSVLQVS